MTTLLVMLVVGAGSYLMRSGPIHWNAHAALPRRADRAAFLAATSALAAVVTSAVLHHSRAGHPEARTAAMVAVVTGLVLSLRKAPIGVVLAAGVGVYVVAGLALSAI